MASPLLIANLSQGDSPMKVQGKWILGVAIGIVCSTVGYGFADDAPPGATGATTSLDTSSGTSKDTPTSSGVTQPAGSSPILAEAASEQTEGNQAGTFMANYFGIFYGPSVSDPSSFQPASDGTPDPSRPLLYKNFLGLGYRITNDIAITPTAYWQWVPVRGGQYAIQDPYVKISHNSLISSGGFNLYGDLRYHVPISDYSRAANSMGGLQTVQVATYIPQGSRYTYGFFGSARVNFYGSQGYGNDVELYAGPNVSYQMTPTLAGMLLFEYNLNHAYGDQNGALKDDGYDVQPGLNWDVSSTILFNPYVNIYPADANLKSTSLGFLISWQAL
jgi:hypothetical protein